MKRISKKTETSNELPLEWFTVRYQPSVRHIKDKTVLENTKTMRISQRVHVDILPIALKDLKKDRIRFVEVIPDIMKLPLKCPVCDKEGSPTIIDDKRAKRSDFDYAGNRIKQLRVWSGLQEQRTRIELLRANLIQGSDDVSEYRSVMSMFGDYALVGTLTLSNTFDGRLRPFMYRVQNGKSGRTLGYLPANEDWELSGLVGQSVGIVGKTTWNPNWRVNVVEATRFDILSHTTATVTPDIQ